MTYTERTTCRVCATTLPKDNLLSLGDQTIVDFLAPGEQGRGKAPLDLVFCSNCQLVQLRHTVNADTLYRTFWYRSGINEQMREALLDIVDSAIDLVDLEDGDVVGDIGSNDGTLLSFYDQSPEWVKRVGFEPALALAEESRAKLQDGVVLGDYFSKDLALAASEGKPYKVLTAIAMFYDLDDPRRFLQEVYSVLEEDGLFIVQMNYLRTMLRNLSFDNISHEHLCYYSLTVLNRLFNRCGLTIVDAELNDVNGGSIRVYAQKNTTSAPRKMRPGVVGLLKMEDEDSDIAHLPRFAQRVKETSEAIRYFLHQLKLANKKVYAYGASTRGSTLLQTILAGIPATDLLVGVAERDPNKFGLRMAGIDLPIMKEQRARADADYFLLLPYHFWMSISRREKDWMAKGGKFIIPVPFPKVAKLQGLSDGQILITEELHEAAGAVG